MTYRSEVKMVRLTFDQQLLTKFEEKKKRQHRGNGAGPTKSKAQQEYRKGANQPGPRPNRSTQQSRRAAPGAAASGCRPPPPRRSTGAREDAALRPAHRRSANSDSLLVLNVSFRTAADDLLPLFDSCGEVTDIYIPRDRRTGDSRGFAFVRYKYEDEAQKKAVRQAGWEDIGWEGYRGAVRQIWPKC
uniref:RRM domain-containing protein n=1 Tax=Oryza brachyantha TaxID=4533 RepID=J3LPC9_ORYBR